MNKLEICIQQPNSSNSENPWKLTVKGIGGRLPQNDGFIPFFKETLEELLPETHQKNYQEAEGSKFAYTAKEPGVAEFDMHKKGYKFTITIPNQGTIEAREFMQSYITRLGNEYQLEK